MSSLRMVVMEPMASRKQGTRSLTKASNLSIYEDILGYITSM